MSSFEYEEKLPEVIKDISYPLNKENNYSRPEITYYKVGDWSMSDLPEEDGDVEYARKTILTWIAWYEYLKANKG